MQVNIFNINHLILVKLSIETQDNKKFKFLNKFKVYRQRQIIILDINIGSLAFYILHQSFSH